MKAANEDRKKRAATRRYHAVRIVLFAAACICAVVGIMMLTMAGDRQIRSETVSSELQRSESQADVLLIMSYNDKDPLTPLARKGVVDVMNASGVSIDVEYMDAINCPKGSAAYRAWVKTLEEKIGDENPYFAVICCDDEALTFVEENHEGLFAYTPVLFFNINDFDHAESITNTGYATGIIEQGNADQMINLARELRPNATKFMAVIDSTPSGVGDRAQFEKALTEIGAKAEYINASLLTREGLQQRLAKADDNTIVFFLDAFNDVSDNAYTRDESARFVSEAAGQPVFGVGSGGVGEGLLGATFTDPEAAGQRTADMCIQVMNGTSPGHIDLVTEGVGGFVFDAPTMEKYGITRAQLPSDAVVINQVGFNPESFTSMVPAFALMIAAIACILIFALMGYRHSVRNTREIISQSNDLKHRFYHDQLTDKPNLQWFKQFMSEPANSERLEGLIEIDFADFGDINDSYGQATGDIVLKEFAQRFEDVKGKLFLLRSTGSEFLLGFDRTIHADGPELQQVAYLLDQPIIIDDTVIDVDAHIGVSNLCDAGNLNDMVTGIDLAVREAKRNGSANLPMFYHERMKRDSEEKIGVTTELKQSIKDESFIVLYQPQVSVRSGNVCGYEALIRMKDDVYYPGQFIPVAEMSGLIIDVDRIVTKKVVQQLAQWKAQGQRVVPVSINFSAVQLRDEGYIDFLLDLLREYNVPPSYIKIEITESLLLDDEEGVDRLLDRLGAVGIKVALDDFGTGYTSLSRVATMPAEVVKIDKSLVDEYAIPGKEGFLDNLVRLIHDLRKVIVVEGVETCAQLQICASLGCDIIQGYYYSKPLLPAAAAAYQPE